MFGTGEPLKVFEWKCDVSRTGFDLHGDLSEKEEWRAWARTGVGIGWKGGVETSCPTVRGLVTDETAV